MDQIEQVEIDIEQAKKIVAKMHTFENLRKNKDFQELIEEDYFTQESKRLTLLMADMNHQDEDAQKMIHDGLIGIGQLFQFFRTIQGLGRQAEASLPGHQETLNELLQEDAE